MNEKFVLYFYVSFVCYLVVFESFFTNSKLIMCTNTRVYQRKRDDPRLNCDELK